MSDKLENDELRPCPFYHENEFDIPGLPFVHRNNWDRYHIMCGDCLARSSFHANAEDAIEAWNKRVADTELERLTLENVELRNIIHRLSNALMAVLKDIEN